MAKKQKKQTGGAGGTPATVALTAAGAAFTVHSYEHDPTHPSYGEEAAEAMGVCPERVFKTLVAEVDGELTVAVVPVSGSLDLKALAAAVSGKRAVLADPAAAERTTGYVRGGISPLGQRKRLRTVLDDSAARHPTICVSAGRRGLEVELAPGDLAELTAAVLAPIGRA
ncbi:Cys-tRNA(Pro) deacylase [Streptomyces alfalfae]|uniref:Cys-tRNA(Pro)/Cys-tRNA(Cys) deacylase n=1 Tax=Streptomyces alfalfae TaxID=1642299 RepID=A0A1P8TMB1_9ACTN|nr:Cys-tRNA(Pro) deacylase [Streptomyces alfalfae]AYA19199.1 Cys-tRNA(Pro) deacylase [Streptomyces fradiae]APY88787.1 aminoacyl-tRNA deacylase [Streptomyces alfalfae]QQC88817.1 Cys-tRNA(Pro) deacylase [Streptomyces alfalfae]RXX36024.1 Cys-tRNA(Pro) deacylase [Streptomyces alfalfae]RZM95571.1 Cys-tRNA(Pro) deacylase [Streptomyces alfalfae]